MEAQTLTSNQAKRPLIGGVLAAACALIACQPTQEVITFQSGSTKSQAEIKSNSEGEPIRHGRFRSWHENGRLHEKGAYLDGKMHGYWTIYDQQGRKRGFQNYDGGRRHGVWLAWHANGQLARKWQYDQGKSHGEWLTWDEDGNLVHKEAYDQGLKLP